MSFIVILDADNSLLYRQKVNDCFFTLMAGFKGLWTAVHCLQKFERTSNLTGVQLNLLVRFDNIKLSSSAPEDKRTRHQFSTTNFKPNKTENKKLTIVVNVVYPLVCYGSVDPNGVIVKEYELEGPKRNMCVCVCVKMCAWGEGLLQPTRSWI